MSKSFAQGFYRPQNPGKYRGDANNIVYRSSWEKRAFMWADLTSDVLEWSSEETVIPYYDETQQRWRRYFVDMWVRVRTADGNQREYLIEIKPYKQTIPPEQPKRRTKRYLNEALTYVQNQCKWKYAKRYAEQRGMKFLVLTEHDLGVRS